MKTSVFFEQEQKNGFKDVTVDCYSHTDGDHGRIEERECFVTDDINWLQDVMKKGDMDGWQDLKSIIMIKTKRTIGEEVTEAMFFYITSLLPIAKIILHAIRSHWGVENNLHWRLDVNFQEDMQRMRMGNSAKNFAILKHMCINLLDNDKQKMSMKQKRKTAALNDQYLSRLLIATNRGN